LRSAIRSAPAGTRLLLTVLLELRRRGKSRVLAAARIGAGRGSPQS